MKKIILVLDAICIVITLLFLFYYNYNESVGLKALEDMGNYVVCLLCLCIEILVMIILGVILILRKMCSNTKEKVRGNYDVKVYEIIM